MAIDTGKNVIGVCVGIKNGNYESILDKKLYSVEEFMKEHNAKIW